MENVFHYNERYYTAICLGTDRSEPGRLEEIVFSGPFSKGNVVASDDFGRLLHARYYTSSPVHLIGESVPLTENINGNRVYAYDTLMLSFRVNRFLSILAFPFSAQAQAVLDVKYQGRSLRSRLVEAGYLFQKVRIDKLIERFKDGDTDGGAMNLSLLKLNVDGDGHIASVRFTSTRKASLHSSSIYQSFIEQRRSSVAYTPRICRVLYNCGRTRCSLTLDAYGNYAVYVGTQIGTLPRRLYHIWKFMESREMLHGSVANPLDRLEYGENDV